MTPRLKRKLVDLVLLRQKNAFAYFFEDFAGKNKAPDGFIASILTQLDSTLYSPG